tara:strand:+ start:1106 stop:1579 length:474 start_codon:yes stop_codon:yes gene_type:complete
MKIIIKILVVASFLFFSASLWAQNYSEKNVKKEVDKIASTLPLRIDSATTLTSLTLDNETLQYSYRIEMDEIFRLGGLEVGLSSSEMRRRLSDQFGSIDKFIDFWVDNRVIGLYTRKNCTTPAIRKIINNGYSLLHTMYEPNGNFLFEFRVTRSDCV